MKEKYLKINQRRDGLLNHHVWIDMVTHCDGGFLWWNYTICQGETMPSSTQFFEGHPCKGDKVECYYNTLEQAVDMAYKIYNITVEERDIKINELLK